MPVRGEPRAPRCRPCHAGRGLQTARPFPPTARWRRPLHERIRVFADGRFAEPLSDGAPIAPRFGEPLRHLVGFSDAGKQITTFSAWTSPGNGASVNRLNLQIHRLQDAGASAKARRPSRAFSTAFVPRQPVRQTVQQGFFRPSHQLWRAPRGKGPIRSTGAGPPGTNTRDHGRHHQSAGGPGGIEQLRARARDWTDKAARPRLPRRGGGHPSGDSLHP